VTYEYAIKKFGTPQGGEPLILADIEAYRGRLPDSFLEFWQKYGLGKWMKGYFQLCYPEKYNPIIESIFEGDKDFHPDKTHAIGFSAFGRIIAWNEQYGTIEIDVLLCRVECGDFFEPDPQTSPDVALETVIELTDAEVNDASDQHGKPMFKRVFKAHGELEFGQMYAPKLHPALGGPFTVDNFRPADALVAMSLAAQAGPFALENTTIPSVPVVRYIGG